MSLIKWKTSKYSIEIDKVEVERETEVSVFLRNKRGEYREAKSSTYCVYHDTWQAARAFLIDQETSKERLARSRLDSAMRNISHLDSLAEPK